MHGIKFFIFILLTNNKLSENDIKGVIFDVFERGITIVKRNTSIMT